MNRFMQHVPAGYPVATIWVAGVADIMAVVGGVLDLPTGILVLTLVFVIAFLAAVQREMRTMRTVVNGRTTALLHRIDDLETALIRANVTLPQQRPGQHETGGQDDSNRRR